METVDHRGRGAKYDQGKLRWSLLPWRALEEVVRVLEHGAEKYGRGSWRLVPNGRERYFDALLRHAAEVAKGNLTDDETGLLHFDHIAVNALFLIAVHRDEHLDQER